ncbi:hypothetical protein MA16_Dca025207 [Dendrobium catenatum]|uniref:Uncharacterized protein n=1 Tax=Dendrobium catenatum TaxID=906689 RepID=A0A2I0WZD9_9ASPA|nr:hypothetical protein MA16_Dca025207 [Dendrobium catenatum]
MIWFIQIKILKNLSTTTMHLLEKSSIKMNHGSEEKSAPATTSEPNYQDLAHIFDHLETHFDKKFDQIETHLQQQNAQHNQDMEYMREQINYKTSNMLMISSYFNFFSVPPPPPPDQSPLQ